MDSFNGYLILSDIDGTLTVRGGEVTGENLRAIRRFQAGGGLFSLATGRQPDYIEKFPFRSNAPVITINGTLLCSPEGEPLVHMPMEEDFEDVLRCVADRHPGVLQIRRHCLPGNRLWERAVHGDNLTPILGGDPVYKFVMICDREETALALMREMLSRFGTRYEFDRSWPVGLEMHRKDSGKGACVRLLRGMLPQVHTIIAAGDYENDISMLREADIGCAVANALPSVKAAADRVIAANTENAIAYLIDTLIPQLPPCGNIR